MATVLTKISFRKMHPYNPASRILLHQRDEETEIKNIKCVVSPYTKKGEEEI